MRFSSQPPAQLLKHSKEGWVKKRNMLHESAAAKWLVSVLAAKSPALLVAEGRSGRTG